MLSKTRTQPEVVEFELNVPDSDIDQLPLQLFDLVEQNRRARPLALLLGNLHQSCG
jgi:hypothetical protein